MIAGQLSDSSCGTLKRLLKNDLKSGKGKMHIRDIFHQLKLFSVMFLNTAEKIVNYCSDQPDLREVNQSRFLKSKTMSRKYYHMTKTLVEEGKNQDKAPETLITNPSILELVTVLQLFIQQKTKTRRQRP